MPKSTSLEPVMTGRNPNGHYQPVHVSTTWEWVVSPSCQGGPAHTRGSSKEELAPVECHQRRQCKPYLPPLWNQQAYVLPVAQTGS